jgi:putative transposase
MSVASFIGCQRTEHDVPHAVVRRAPGVSESWFYKWHDRPTTPRQRRREALVAAITEGFEASGRTYGSPRVHAELRDPGLAGDQARRCPAHGRRGSGGPLEAPPAQPDPA